MAPIDPAHDDAQAAALADVAMGRTIGCDAIVQWLGGWHLGRLTPADRVREASGDAGRKSMDANALPIDTSSGSDASGVPDPAALGQTPLVWTETAVIQCHRLRQHLARYGDDADARFAGALVAAMVELIVEGIEPRGGIVDVPVRPPLMLRLLAQDDRVAILGLHWAGSIV